MSYLERGALILIGLLIACAGRWMFVHPGKAISKMYADLVPPTSFTKFVLRAGAGIVTISGLWAACMNAVPGHFLNTHVVFMGVVLFVFVLIAAFVLLRS